MSKIWILQQIQCLRSYGQNIIHTMKIPAFEHFPRCSTNTSKFINVMEVTKRKLMKQQLRLFRKDIFSYFVKMDNYVINSMIVHNSLLKQVVHGECDRLLSSAQLKDFAVVHMIYIRRQKLQPTRGYMTLFFTIIQEGLLKNSTKAFEDLDFYDMDDIDALKIMLYYFAEYLMGEKDECTQNLLSLHKFDYLQ